MSFWIKKESTTAESERDALKAELDKARAQYKRDMALAGSKVDSLVSDIKKARPFNPVLHSNGPTDFSYWKRQLTLLSGKSKCMLILMELRSGKRDFLVISSQARDFTYDGKTYILADYGRYHIPSLDMFAYNYHVDISVPVQHIIEPDKIRREIKAADVIQCEEQIDPAILDEYIKAKITSNVIASGAKLHDYLKIMLTLLIILVAELTIFFIIFVVKTGMLDNIKTGLNL